MYVLLLLSFLSQPTTTSSRVDWILQLLGIALVSSCAGRNEYVCFNAGVHETTTLHTHTHTKIRKLPDQQEEFVWCWFFAILSRDHHQRH